MKYLVIFSLLFSVAAHADQCEVLTQSQTIAAKALLERSVQLTKGYVDLCQNCGSTEAEFVRSTGAFKAVKFDTSLKGTRFTLKMANSTRILDAAYLYVYTNQLSNRGNYLWFNLAELIGCEYKGSSKVIAESKINHTHSKKFFNGAIAQ